MPSSFVAVVQPFAPAFLNSNQIVAVSPDVIASDFADWPTNVDASAGGCAAAAYWRM